jgi:hypothetical protein
LFLPSVAFCRQDVDQRRVPINCYLIGGVACIAVNIAHRGSFVLAHLLCVIVLEGVVVVVWGNREFRLNPGDTIYTSGYSAIFPPDIPLGVAGEAKVINGATNEIRVKLFQDHSALKYVTIIENTRIKEIEEIENSDNQNKGEKK